LQYETWGKSMIETDECNLTEPFDIRIEKWYNTTHVPHIRVQIIQELPVGTKCQSSKEMIQGTTHIFQTGSTLHPLNNLQV
jgi:hypothetical protein